MGSFFFILLVCMIAFSTSFYDMSRAGEFLDPPLPAVYDSYWSAFKTQYLMALGDWDVA